MEKPEFNTIDDYSVAVMTRLDVALLSTLLSLANVTSAQPLGEPAES